MNPLAACPRKLLVGLVMVLGLLAVARPASALSGFYVGKKDAHLESSGAEVVLMRDGLRTVVTMQSEYQGPLEPFAMVVPVPQVLTEKNVRTVPRELVRHVSQLGAPRLQEYWEEDPCAATTARGTDAGPMASARTTHEPGSGTQPGPDAGVSVLAAYDVGEYDIVLLDAKDALDLLQWLGAHGYAPPPNTEAYLQPYVAAGMKFFVAKVDPARVKTENGKAMLSPLRFHYDAEKLTVPLRLGLLSAKEEQDLLVHVLARRTRYEAASYENATIPTNLNVAPDTRGAFDSFYSALLDRTFEQNPGAVVTEYAWDATTCELCTAPGLGPDELMALGADVLPRRVALAADAGAPDLTRRFGSARPGAYGAWVLTRLHLRTKKTSAAPDLVLREAEPISGGRETIGPDGALLLGGQKGLINAFQARYAIRHAWTGSVECKAPRRNTWTTRSPNAAGVSTPPLVVASGFPAKRDVALTSFLTSSVLEIGLQAPVASGSAAPAPSTNVAPDAGTTTSPRADKDACGCSVIGSARAGLGATTPSLAAAAVASLLLLRRSRNRRRHHT
jgi:hypothetical protein